MSVARGFGLNGKSLYSNIAKPCEINVQFTVDATNGLGITSLKSNGYVRNVFMHTSVAPAANNGYTNPNPANGFILVQLENNLNKYLGHYCAIQSPNSGVAVKIDNSAMTVGQAYTITVLGDASLAKWQAIGVPVGVTPAVGVSFVALTNGGAGNVLTSRVQAPSVSGIQSVEIVGNPDASTSEPIASNGGEWLMLQALSATDATTTTMIPKAPADGSIVSMRLYYDGSSVSIDGL